MSEGHIVIKYSGHSYRTRELAIVNPNTAEMSQDKF